MGQYFKIVNPARKEYIKPVGGMKAIELCSGETGKLLAYLLLDGPQDGTAFIYRNADPEGVTQEDREKERNQDIISGEPKEDEIIAQFKESRRTIREANEYAGRWAGETVLVTGDYAEHGIIVDGGHKNHNYYEDIRKSDEWTDITKGALEEFKKFMGESYEESKELLRPDLILRA